MKVNKGDVLTPELVEQGYRVVKLRVRRAT